VKTKPPTGLRPGEKLSDYKRLTVRLPDDVREELEAAGYVLGRQQWRVLVDAIKAYVGSGPTLSEIDQQAIRKALRSRSGRLKPEGRL
jgi:hypothetical protein